MPRHLVLAILSAAALATALPSSAAPIDPTSVVAPGTVVRGSPGVARSRVRIHLGDLARRPPTLAPDCEAPDHSHERPRPMPVPPGLEPDPGGAPVSASAVGIAGASSPPPAASFLALGDNATLVPPDTHGAVGPDHLVVMLNTEVRVQDRSGSPILTVTLVDFWSALGFTFPFDPRVVYDPHGERFIAAVTSGSETATASILVGVTETSDPTGNWLLYQFDADPLDRSWADYPTLGFSRDWIVVSANLYSSGGSFRSANLFAIDKADLYGGGAGDFTLWSQTDIGATHQPAVTLDPDIDRAYLLNDWNGDSGGLGVVRLYDISGPVAAPSLTIGPLLAVAETWASGADSDFAPQLGTIRRIQTNSSSMQNLVYRNGSLWATHTVFLPAASPSRAAAQWWEILPAGSVRQRGRVEDPSGSVFYAFPSIAVNRQNDVLIGYSRFSASTYASAGYSFRDVTDPPGAMRDGVVLKAGEAPYDRRGGTRNRWGDYSNTVVDPRNDIDLWTIQEYASLQVNLRGRWSTWWGQIAPPRCLPPVVAGPDAVEVCAGAELRLAVAASGVDPLSYRWRRDGTILIDDARTSGTTADTLVVNPAVAGDTGSYDVVVGDACGGSTVSATAAIRVFAAPPADPGNVLFAVRAPGVVSLTWTGDPDASFHEIERCDASAGPCQPVTYSRVTGLRLDDGQATADLYWYQFVAGNACGTSP